MTKMITLTIDQQAITVPAGTLVVDAAKQAGITIPVFCHHPKLEPVGMCRMCLVEIGRPMVDRTTGQPVLEADGTPRISVGPKLETSCTTPVSEGMVVKTVTEEVRAARREMLEFILTSHPLDCPVCDKGGECPLQNLTQTFGPGETRFVFDEKMHLSKHVPLGELIYLDRERCIQCGRCVRFQHEVAAEPVLNFSHRGRALEIVTYSKPGFDSIFSGNTTDICPVGALTTADFRFGARAWEVQQAASICNHCPVGCNLTVNTRREAASGGRTVIKRIMPRQNEQVNEIWICDKGRFAYHYTESESRLLKPLIRRGSEFLEATWDEALDLVARKSKSAAGGLLTLAGGRLSNEDLFNLHCFTTGLGGKAALYSSMAGGGITRQVGVSQGTNLGELGQGSAILVAACDLHEEAPIWWLRVRQAAERGAALILVTARQTSLEKFATHVVRCDYGGEVEALEGLLTGKGKFTDAARAFAGAANAIAIYGSDGLDAPASTAVANACARLLVQTGHVGRPNNGLMAAWPNGNTQGAFEIGFSPLPDLASDLKQAKVVYVAAADPAGDSPALAKALKKTGFLVVQELFLTETAKMADVVLPALPFTEREGTFTSAERRVQRYYPVLPQRPGPRSDFSITAELGVRAGLKMEGRAAALVFSRIAQALPVFEGISYQSLAQTFEQTPAISRHDMYYGGTGYENSQGLGVQLAPLQRFAKVELPAKIPQPIVDVPKGSLRVAAITRLYDHGNTVEPSSLLHLRQAVPAVHVSPRAAKKLGIQGTRALLTGMDGKTMVDIVLDETAPDNAALMPRSVGLSGTILSKGE